MAATTKMIRIDPRKLIPNENNVRIHGSETAILDQSVKDFGFLSVVTVNEDYKILSGHARAQAAINAGFDEIDVMVVKGLSEVEQKAFMLADNRIGELSTNDQDAADRQIMEINSILGEGFMARFACELPEVDVSLPSVDEDPEPEMISDDRGARSLPGDSLKLLVVCNDPDERDELMGYCMGRNIFVQLLDD